MSDITHVSAAEIARSLAQGEISSVEVTTAYLARMEATEGVLGSFLARSS